MKGNNDKIPESTEALHYLLINYMHLLAPPLFLLYLMSETNHINRNYHIASGTCSFRTREIEMTNFVRRISRGLTAQIWGPYAHRFKV
jgi:hypothetical protein